MIDDHTLSREKDTTYILRGSYVVHTILKWARHSRADQLGYVPIFVERYVPMYHTSRTENRRIFRRILKFNRPIVPRATILLLSALSHIWYLFFFTTNSE